MNNLEEGTQLMLQFKKRDGLLPVVVQEPLTGQVLMVGYTNHDALRHSLESRYATFWSTSRQTLWTKGQTFGDWLRIVDIWTNFDQDALLYQVELEGNGVYHTKSEHGRTRKACFYGKINFSDLSLAFASSFEANPE